MSRLSLLYHALLLAEGYVEQLAQQAAAGQQFEAQLQRLIAELHPHCGHVAA